MTVPQVTTSVPGGPGDAPLLVLGPSLGTSAILWEDVVPMLSDRFRVVVWDLPGHGASAPTVVPFTVADLADALVASVLDPFFYAGVSLGGAVGLELALRHPDRVRALAPVASGAQLGEPAGWHDRAAQVREQSTSSVIVASAQRWFADGSIARRPELTGRLLHALQDADDESYALCCEALAAYDVRDRLGGITAPVLALWGRHDRVAPEAKSLELAEGVADGRAVVIDGAAHQPPAEQPEATARALRDFFGSFTSGRLTEGAAR